jgi:hypothetical protein
MDGEAESSSAPEQKGGRMDIVEQIKGVAADHETEIVDGIEKIGDFVDDKTGGQYAAQVDQAQSFLKDQLGGAADTAR